MKVLSSSWSQIQDGFSTLNLSMLSGLQISCILQTLKESLPQIKFFHLLDFSFYGFCVIILDWNIKGFASGCKDIEIRKLELVSMTQFLSRPDNYCKAFYNNSALYCKLHKDLASIFFPLIISLIYRGKEDGIRI